MNVRVAHGIRDIPLTTIDGSTTTLTAFGDQVLLLVNVASRCGLAPQYEGLEWLHRAYSEQGFSVLGFPSNQFRQEMSSEEAIREYCDARGVTFPLFARVKVNGHNQHPIYAELTKIADANGKAGRVQWNYEKFLLTSDGRAMRWRPTTEPDSPEIVAAVEEALARSS